MELLQRQPHLDRLARPDRGRCVDHGDEILLGQAQVEQLLVAQVLDHVAGGAEAGLAGLGRPHVEVLGAEAGDYLPPAQRSHGAAQSGRQGEAQPVVDEGGALPGALQAHGHEVHGRGADEAGHETVEGPVVELARGAHLLQQAGVHDGDAAAHGHRLDLVVGDVDDGRAQALVEAGDLGPRLHPQLGVEVAERLVHEEDGRLAHDGPAQGHALALAT
ncbi:MAG: hypothetical protein A2X23_08395 [Chloroflexi bacterium GWC2_73_18]|nr:MAG: hypothetical protein A2X23_08395 [Chloroflexi bacterium GWC2_73_18]